MSILQTEFSERTLKTNNLPSQDLVLVHTKEVVVRFSEVDALGIVWHGHYVTYMEDGRESFGAEYGLDYLYIKSQGYTVPLVHIACSYKRSFKYGDTVIIETTFIPCQAAKIQFKYRMFEKGHPELVAEGETVQVFLDENQQLSLINPTFFEEWKTRVGLQK